VGGDLQPGDEDDQRKTFRVFPLGEEATQLLECLGGGPDPQRSFAYLRELPTPSDVVARLGRGRVGACAYRAPWPE
jgi:hypothetical protein